MAKTYADVYAGIRTFLDEAQPQNWSDAEVLHWANYAYHYVVTKVMEVYEEFYLTTTPKSYNIVANQQEYTLDTTLLKIERVEINYNSTNPNSQPLRAVAIKLDELPLNLANNQLSGSGLYNAGYYIIGSQSVQKIGFVPIPTIAGTGAIQVWGIEAPSDLSATTDPILIPYPDQFTQIIEKMAAANLLKKGQEEIVGAKDLMQEVMSDILNMMTFIKERQSDGPQMIIESAYDDVAVGDMLW